MVVLVLLVVLLAVSIARGVHGGFDRSNIKEVGNPDAKAPEITAEGAEMYSLDLDEVVYSKNPDERIDPYSITKVLTCYLALENLDKDKVVEISANAAKVLEDGTSINLREGEEIRIEDLLYGAMMESGNDAATALGEAVAGNISEFSEMMTEQAKDWGCTNTSFANANGWQNEEHYTTAHDMCIIARKCFENKDLRKIARTKTHTIAETNKTPERKLENHTLSANKKVKYFDCGKTGGWSPKDCSIVVEFQKDHLRGAIVLLRDTEKARPNDLNKLIEFSSDVTPGFEIAEEGADVAETKVKGGAETKADLAMDKKIFVYPKKNKKSAIKVTLQTDKLKAPVKKGDAAGTYKVIVDGKEVDSGNLIANDDVKKGWILSNIYISNRATVIGGIILLIILASILLIKKISNSKIQSGGSGTRYR